MEERTPAKLPIPRLPRAISTSSGIAKKSPATKLAAKREKDRNRIYIGHEFQRWRDLRILKHFKTDAAVATFLLNCYKKLDRASSTEQPELQPNQCDRCPSCGFVSSQWSLLDRNASNNEQQPESIEVTLEVEQKDDPVSGAEEADGESDVSEKESDVSEEESEGSGVNEEWTPTRHYTRTLIKPTETAAGEEEQSEGSGVNEGNEGGESSNDDWSPGLRFPPSRTRNKPLETATAKEETEHRPGKMKLCIECGVFYKKKHHECEHKTRPFVCNICGRRCVSEKALKIHNRIHSLTYEHPCKYCYAGFKSRVEKLAHELIHQEQKDPYKCPDCAQTFPTFLERKEHIKTHGNPLNCSICGIVFTESSSFLRHAAVHTREKAFKCPECERSFTQASHLKSHMRLHSGERPYSCKYCDKSFNHNVSLKSHVQRYHPTEQEEMKEGGEAQSETPEREEETTVKQKYRNKRPPTGRPKGRPKRNAMGKRKYSKTDDSEEES